MMDSKPRRLSDNMPEPKLDIVTKIRNLHTGVLLLHRITLKLINNKT